MIGGLTNPKIRAKERLFSVVGSGTRSRQCFTGQPERRHPREACGGDAAETEGSDQNANQKPAQKLKKNSKVP